jgi:predicted Fe-Mo cluster-binding NifX family protein
MKTAIASETKEENEISSRGARASYYLVYEDKKLIEVRKNPFAVGGGGAGYSVAHMLTEKGVKKFISEKVGPNMQEALKEKGIEFKEIQGKKVKEAL